MLNIYKGKNEIDYSLIYEISQSAFFLMPFIWAVHVLIFIVLHLVFYNVFGCKNRLLTILWTDHSIWCFHAFVPCLPSLGHVLHVFSWHLGTLFHLFSSCPGPSSVIWINHFFPVCVSSYLLYYFATWLLSYFILIYFTILCTYFLHTYSF